MSGIYLLSLNTQQSSPIPKSNRELSDEAIFLERTLCGEAGGIQDQIAAAFGGLNRIEFNEHGYTVNPLIVSSARKRELNENLIMFFTGFSRFSDEIQTGIQSTLGEKTKQLLEMKRLVYEAEDILNSKKDMDEFGKLLDYTWKLKRGLSPKISTDTIDGIYDVALKNGAIGGKLLGAGGGGFLVFYCEKEKQPSLVDALRGLLRVPFEFEADGTRVIFYTPEDYER